MPKQEDRAEPDKKRSIRVGGRELQEGQSLSPAEAEEFIKNILSGTPGPVTIQNTDASSGLSSSTRVNEWFDFVDGPTTNREARDTQVGDLREKGYLAFRQDPSGKIECETPYRALTPQYFQDSEQFLRCQDIPDRYLRPVSAAPTWFVSHRWGSPDHPDPTGTQFRVLRQFLERNEAKLIWYDFSCVPQEPLSASERSLFRESVKNLNSLVIASDFVSILTDDYMTRAWCYYEWVVSELLCCGKRALIRPKDTPADCDEHVNALVLEGKIPHLNVTKNADMPAIENLLLAGVEMFKTLALSVTLEVLNDFGFDFGVGIASRFAGQVDFGRLWMIWQILAGSSHHSGIRLPHLLNRKQLGDILNERHERFGTHARIYQELGVLAQTPLDMRIVEQKSQEHLLSLMVGARHAGPLPATYTRLALIKLVYAMASTSNDGRT